MAGCGPMWGGLRAYVRWAAGHKGGGLAVLQQAAEEGAMVVMVGLGF